MISKRDKTKKRQKGEVSLYHLTIEPCPKNNYFIWLKNFLALWLPILFLLWLQPFTNFVRDNNQISLLDLAVPLYLAIATSILIALIFYRAFTKNRFLALLLAIGFFVAIKTRVDIKLQPVWNLLRSFAPFEKAINLLGFYNLILLTIIAVIVAYYLFKKINNWLKTKKINLDKLYNASLIAITAAFLIQLYSVVKIAYIEWPQFFYRPEPLSSERSSSDVARPDIYYIVLDRYTNGGVLKDQLGFDNSYFTGFLEDKGFYVKRDAYSNYQNTAGSISSTLKANYHSDLASKFGSSRLHTYQPYFNSAYYSPVVSELKSLGYKYYNLGSYYEISNRAPLADYNANSGSHLNIMGRVYPLNTFETREIKNSIYWPFINRGLKIRNFSVLTYAGLNQRDQSKFSLTKLKELAEEPSGSRFIFSHILIPHNPYFFNSDGTLSEYPQVSNVGKPIKEKYIGQVEFVNSQVKEIVEKILQKDDRSIIILQADEGPYPKQEKMPPDGSPPEDPEMSDLDRDARSQEDMQMKYGILAAYHLPETDQETLKNNINSVNIFRIVLNSYFGYNLPYLPMCSYSISGNKKAYTFREATTRITGVTNPDCPENGIFKN